MLTLALVIERLASLRERKVAPARLLDEVLAIARNGLPNADLVAQLERNSALGEVLASGFRALHANPRCSESDLRAAMEGAGRLVAHRLQRYLSALATIASTAPLLGLFGTVVGMIEIFGSQGPVGPGANPAQLAQGIAMANDTDYGLANSVWTNDNARAARVAEAMVVGNSWINAHNVFAHGVPYGGVKKSGLGGGVLSPDVLMDYYRSTSVVRPIQ